MLKIENLNCYYGKLHVLRDVSLEVGKETVALLGPNGAGKTTLINTILGLMKPGSGAITFDGESITELKTHETARRGVALVPQGRELFPSMSVADNLTSGAAYNPRATEGIAERQERVFELFPILKERMKQLAGTLSGGQQRMLAVGRALMSNPKLLILDEPSLGLQPSLVTELFDRLNGMRGEVCILVTEQNVRASLRIADRGYVLENGAIVMQDSAESLKNDPHLVKSYLGL
ncbi:MAG: ABC transporter ATP-binding protein [Spirochaetaceae bacterium]